MMKKIYINIIISLIMAVIVMGCVTTYEGRVAVKGSEPHTYTVLVTPDNVEYKIVGDLAQLIYSDYQNRIIKVRGKITREAIGPGMPAELLVYEIIKVEE